MQNYGYVYKTTNKINGRVYIGQKKGDFNPEYFGSGLLIAKAVNKHGINNFSIKILAHGLTKKQLDQLEKDFIAKYRKLVGKNNVYNISDGGQGGKVWKFPPTLGRVPSKEEVQAFVERIKKITPFSPEHIANMKKARAGLPGGMVGKKHSEKTIKKMIKNHPDFSGENNPMSGKHHSQATKIKQSKSAKKGWLKRTAWKY